MTDLYSETGSNTNTIAKGQGQAKQTRGQTQGQGQGQAKQTQAKQTQAKQTQEQVQAQAQAQAQTQAKQTQAQTQAKQTQEQAQAKLTQEQVQAQAQGQTQGQVQEQALLADEIPDINSLPNYLKEWLALEEEVKSLSTAMRERKKRMGILQGLITKTMKSHKIARVNIKSGAVLYQNKSTKETMSKKFLIANLTDYFKGDALKASELYNYLEGKRAKKEKESVKLEKN
jgi:multidrug efflux pump subunit AcrA (membrane-fusion protein)